MACTTREMTFMWTMAGMTPLEVSRFNGPSKGYLRPLTLAQKPLWYLCRGEGHSGLHPFLSPKLLYICTLPGTFLPPTRGRDFFVFVLFSLLDPTIFCHSFCHFLQPPGWSKPSYLFLLTHFPIFILALLTASGQSPPATMETC